MEKAALDKRLQELGLYRSYYYRQELKPLAEALEEGEQLNCIFTGVHENNRKLVALTDRRILIVFTAALASGELKSIPKDCIKSCHYEGKFFFPKATIITEENDYVFTGVQHGQKATFDWARYQLLGI